MHTLAFANLKGGAGKSTTSWHVAVSLDTTGQGPVAAVDLDGQATFSKRLALRNQTRPSDTFGLLDVQRLDQLPEAHAAAAELGAKWCIIDTPPSVTGAAEVAMKLADLIVIPVKPNLVDIEAALRTVEMAQSFNKKFVFVINESTGKAKAMDALTALSSLGPVCPFVIPRLNSFTSCWATGLSLPEIESTIQADIAGVEVLGKAIKFIIGHVQ